MSSRESVNHNIYLRRKPQNTWRKSHNMWRDWIFWTKFQVLKDRPRDRVPWCIQSQQSNKYMKIDRMWKHTTERKKRCCRDHDNRCSTLEQHRYLHSWDWSSSLPSCHYAHYCLSDHGDNSHASIRDESEHTMGHNINRPRSSSFSFSSSHLSSILSLPSREDFLTGHAMTLGGGCSILLEKSFSKNYD